jgi:hypothetical protein
MRNGYQTMKIPGRSTKLKYVTAIGKRALMLLQSAATLIPVPLIQEAIGVALKIIEVSEGPKILPKLAHLTPVPDIPKKEAKLSVGF